MRQSYGTGQLLVVDGGAVLIASRRHNLTLP
jgi:hypothetical protein